MGQRRRTTQLPPWRYLLFLQVRQWLEAEPAVSINGCVHEHTWQLATQEHFVPDAVLRPRQSSPVCSVVVMGPMVVVPGARTTSAGGIVHTRPSLSVPSGTPPSRLHLVRACAPLFRTTSSVWAPFPNKGTTCICGRTHLGCKTSLQNRKRGRKGGNIWDKGGVPRSCRPGGTCCSCRCGSGLRQSLPSPSTGVSTSTPDSWQRRSTSCPTPSCGHCKARLYDRWR